MNLLIYSLGALEHSSNNIGSYIEIMDRGLITISL